MISLMPCAEASIVSPKGTPSRKMRTAGLPNGSRRASRGGSWRHQVKVPHCGAIEYSTGVQIRRLRFPSRAVLTFVVLTPGASRNRKDRYWSRPQNHLRRLAVNRELNVGFDPNHGDI
jgi:hypothetical protein